jgi:hypothetical protein
VVNDLLQNADEEEAAAHDHLSHGQHPAPHHRLSVQLTLWGWIKYGE